MLKDKVTKRSLRLGQSDSSIIGFRTPKEISHPVKIEAAQREMPIDALFVEMWKLYLHEKREK